MVNFSLAGKAALVTGAGQDTLGHGIALCLAEQGANVVVCDLPSKQEALAKVVDQLTDCGVTAAGLTADVTNRAELVALFDGAEKALGVPIDIVVACVGGDPASFAAAASANAHFSPGTEKPLPQFGVVEPLRGAVIPSTIDISFEDYLRVTTLTQFATWHTCQEAGQRMAKSGNGGRIVIIGSVMADMAHPGVSSYSAAKASIRQLGKTMANELGPLGITVNVVQPGHMLSALERRSLSDSHIATRSHNIPVRRMGDTKDVGAAVAFLCSPAASYVTGATLDVDGGWNVAKTLRTDPPPSEGEGAAKRPKLN